MGLVNHDPFDLDGQAGQIADAEERARIAARAERDDLVWLMQQKRGRRIVARLIGQSGPYRSTFNSNAMTMAFQEGLRNFSVALVDKLTTHCMDLYLQMLREQSQDE
jgi:hypothetical protein